MDLHFFVPNLFWSEAALPEIYEGLTLPAIETFLAKSMQSQNESQGIEAWLCSNFNIEKQQDWPVASITLLADKAENIQLGDGYWLRADPVHLRVEHNHVILADSHVLHISIEEARQFVDAINKYFAENNLHLSSQGPGTRGIVILPLSSDRWYLCLAKTPIIHTHMLSYVAKKNINNFLPFGAENIFWRGIFNEIQMFLHEHPLNKAREERGELAVNGIWLWGGGFMPKLVRSSYTHVWSNDILPNALALASNTDYSVLPENITKWQKTIVSGSHLIFINTLHEKFQCGDAHGWRDDLKGLEENWFSPLLKAFRDRNINQIVITTIDRGKARSFTITKNCLRKFWRVRESLSNYVN